MARPSRPVGSRRSSSGDLNAVPRSRAYARLAARLRDAQRACPPLGPGPHSRLGWPFLRIDHVFVSRSIEVLGIEVRPDGPRARAASDHLPLVVDFRVFREENNVAVRDRRRRAGSAERG